MKILDFDSVIKTFEIIILSDVKSITDAIVSLQVLFYGVKAVM